MSQQVIVASKFLARNEASTPTLIISMSSKNMLIAWAGVEILPHICREIALLEETCGGFRIDGTIELPCGCIRRSTASISSRWWWYATVHRT